jgi:hypothetical protein
MLLEPLLRPCAFAQVGIATVETPTVRSMHWFRPMRCACTKDHEHAACRDAALPSKQRTAEVRST